MIKVLIFVVVIYLVYKFFFNKKRDKTKENDQIEDVMMACPTCGTYISKDEAILSNGKYFCSEKCLKG